MANAPTPRDLPTPMSTLLDRRRRVTQDQGARRATIKRLQAERLQVMGTISDLNARLNQVREDLRVHTQRLAEEDAKNILELPPTYKQQGRPRRFRCLGWRATDGCDPNGKRVPENDRSCLQYVQPKMSGFCEIEDRDTGERFRVMKTSCDTLRWDAKLRCFEAWDFPNFAIKSQAVLRNVSMNAQPVLAEQKQKNQGIIIVVYPKLLPSAYATLRTLRRQNCTLPVEIWIKNTELNASHPILQSMLGHFGPTVLRTIVDKDVEGFTTKIHAIRHSVFDDLLFLDADNVPIKDPTYLFDLPEYLTTGALFWPDFWHPDHTIFHIHPRSLVWEYLGLPFIDMFEQESGQIVINRRKHRAALELVHLYAFHKPNVLDRFKIVHGDKDLFRFAWLKANASFHMVNYPPAVAGNILGGMFCGQTMAQHDPSGSLLFLHRNAKKLEGRRVISVTGKGPKMEIPPFERARHEVPAFERAHHEVPMETKVVEDPAIWTHLLQFKPTSTRAEYTIEIFKGSSAFPEGQFCYGKPSPAAGHFNTFRFEDLAFRDLETEIRGYAREATDLEVESPNVL